MAAPVWAQVPANQLPTGGSIAGGTGTINAPAATSMAITQTSNRMALTWSTFDVGSSAQVTFSQPSSSALISNQVQGGNPTQIFGKINSNGGVILTNDNGMILGSTHTSNTGGLLLATHHLSAANFMSGNDVFDATPNSVALMSHSGNAIASTGSINLFGGKTVNSGTLSAASGNIHLLVADGATATYESTGLRLQATSGVQLQLDTHAVENSGTLTTTGGGDVTLEARAARGLFDTAIYHSGSISTRGTAGVDGNVALLATGGSIQSIGSIDAGSGNLNVVTTGAFEQSGTTKAGVLAGAVAGNASLSASDNSITSIGDLQVNGNLALSNTGALGQNGALTVGGTTTLANGGSAITLNNADNDFGGAVAAVGGDITLVDANALKLASVASKAFSVTSNGQLDLGTSTVSGTLSARSNNGAVVQTGALSVTGASSVNAGTGAIALTNAGNDFGAAVALTGGATQIRDANALTLGALSTGSLNATSSGALNLGNGSVGGTLQAVSNNSAVGQSGALTVAGTASINAGTGAITLNNAANDFQGVVALTGAGTQITDANGLRLGLLTTGALTASSGGALDLGSGTIGGALVATTNSGAVTQSGALNVAGTTSINAGKAAITLLNTNNDFKGAVTLSGGAVQISTAGALLLGSVSSSALTVTSNGALNLGAATVGGSLDANSNNGAVGQTGALNVAGTATINAGSGTVTLTNAGNDFGGVVNATGSKIALADAKNLTLGNLTASTVSLAVGGTATATGAITADTVAVGSGTLAISSNAALAMAGNVTLSSAAAAQFTSAAGTPLSVATSLSGTGGVLKDGAGALQLTGKSTYLGATQVNAGTLQVSGVLGPTAVTVAKGAQLTGSGTLGGVVTVADGGVLAGASGQTLTTGALTLGSGAIVQAALGAPGGGGLFQVNGALALNGQLQITDAGGYSAGVYRLFDYTGALSGNGLTVASQPAGSTASVQTAVAGTVNLVNTGGQTLNFWDGGTPANHNNNQIDGGSGTWNATAPNWTTANGSVNAAMTPMPGFAIFQGPSGTVTVSEAQGAVSATGMQFAVDGYRLQGEALTLAPTAGNAVVRVGDGAGDAAKTATIDNVLQGTARLEKTGDGTLVLNGANTYSGGTLVSGGTLQGNTISLRGDIANNAGVVFDQATSGTYAGSMSGTGKLVKTGAGTLTLAAANTHSGTTSVDAGTLAANVTGALGTTGAAVASGATLALGGTMDLQGLALTNAGNLQFTGQSAAGGAAIDNGAGGQLDLSGVGGDGLSIGSLGGAGNVLLGAKTLTTGGLNTSTTVSGTVSGTGGLVKTGTGTLTLSGSNGYSGGTTVQAGVLSGHAGSFGTGAIVNQAQLELNQPGDAALVNAVSGTGVLVKQGAGNLTLGNRNSYSGGTTVGAGTLTGGAGSFGSGAITNNAALVLSQADDATLANAIGGTGTLTKTGVGNLTLTGANTYGGGTAIAGGMLTGAAASFGSGGIAIANNSALVLAQDTDGTLAGTISGPGKVGKTGGGNLTLADVNSYAGGTTISAGTLTGTASSFGSGGVVSDAQLVLAQASDALLANAVSGSGTVTKTGSGRLTLASGNTYGGGTTVAAGILAGSTTSFGIGGIVNNAVLVLDQAGDATLVNTVSGSGRFDKAGAGNLRLAEVNTYRGGTTVAAGTLTGTATSFGAGPIANNAALVIEQAADATLANAVTGTGSLSKTGSGNLRLSNANSYSGGTVVSAGTLTGSATSFGSGAIANNAALVIDESGDSRLSNTLSGSGSLTKTGAGTLRYTGNGSAFSGQMRVDAGALSVDGSLGGTLVIGSGGVLKGTGTVGATTLAAGAIAAPGNSIGTLSVAGDLTFQPGSSYQVEVDAAKNGDRINVSGRATLGGASVAVLAANGTWQPVTNYTVLSANGGLVGRFGQVTSDLAFLTPTLRYSPTEVNLSLVRNDVSFESIAATPNERNVAAAVAGTGTGTLYNAVVQQSAAGARTAFKQLSGEVHASAKTAMLEDSRFVREAGLDRLRQGQGQGAGMSMSESGNGNTTWTRVFGSDGRIDGDGNASRLNRDVAGLFVGGDTLLTNGWRAGALAGYSKSNVDVDGDGGSAKADSYHVGVYGGSLWNAASVRLGASYTWNRLDTQRNVSFPGFADKLKADYDIGTAQVFGEIGQRVDLGTVAVEPFAGLAYVNIDAKGFNETGGAAALRSTGGRMDTTFGTLGVRASASVSEATRVRGTVGWRHAIGDRMPTSTASFATGSAFSASGVPLARNVAIVEAGVETHLKTDMTLGLSYAGQFGDGLRDHGLKLALGWKF